jgi:predicted amidohydrolase
VKVAVYQAPLAACFDGSGLILIRQQIDRCEALGVELLCCPEAVLGGLAEYVDAPARIALRVDTGALARALMPLASATVATVLGFTELDHQGRLFNAAALLAHGRIIGVYRKHHPAINRSVYQAGNAAPTFTVRDITCGIVICRDSTFVEPAQTMIDQGAQLLLIPTNNGMPATRGGPELVAQALVSDRSRATQDGIAVIRADVAGTAGELESYGASAIVDCDGEVVASALPLTPDLVVAEIDFRNRPNLSATRGNQAACPSSVRSNDRCT